MKTKEDAVMVITADLIILVKCAHIIVNMENATLGKNVCINILTKSAIVGNAMENVIKRKDVDFLIPQSQSKVIF